MPKNKKQGKEVNLSFEARLKLNTLMFEAVRKNNLKALKAALSAGAEVNWPTGHYRESALLRAVYLGNFEMVKYLVENGADVNAIDRCTSGTPLMCAADKGHFKIIKYLVEHGARVGMLDDHGSNALYYAKTDEIRKYLESALKKKK
ncbi:MAG: ankyrin repeat domain-containing protein [Candidatus Micrarchaeota archaeon]